MFASINWDSTLNLPKTNLPIRQTTPNDSQYRSNISEQLYQVISTRNTEKFTLIDGPPFANGDLHVGHALNKFLKDTILRYKALQGHTVQFRPGWDCHGLPIEIKALQNYHQSRKQHDNSSEPLDPIHIRSLCRKFALEAVQRQKASMKEWGLLANFENPYLTIDPDFEANQLNILADMVDKGLIFSAKKPVYYSPSSRTALAEAELEYSDNHVSLTSFIRFKAILSDDLRSKLPDKNSSVYLVAWTTTPWTLPANKALAVGENLIYSLLKSSNDYIIVAQSRIAAIRTDLKSSLEIIKSDFCTGKELAKSSSYESLSFGLNHSGLSYNPILLADFVSEDSGSGIVHLAPDYGSDDYEVCKLNDILPSSVDLLNDHGDFNNSAPAFLTGSNIFTGASETILEYLKCTGSVLSSSYYTHRYPYDWRTKRPVIQRATRQWFASITSLLPQLQKSLETVQFIPERGKEKMLSMLKTRSEWCISRQRHWGLPIPAFLDKDSVPVLDSQNIRHISNLVRTQGGSDIWWTRSMDQLLLLPAESNGKFIGKSFDTLDVWFDSGTVWNNFDSADLYLEGSDQYRGWFQSSLITSVAVTGVAPYKTILTHGFALDQKGQKMSKSVGNVINPAEIISKEGSDVLRLWAAGSNFTSDVTIGPEIIKQVVENKRKIRNTLRFILGNLIGYDPDAKKTISRLDQLILHKFETVMSDCNEAYKQYDFATVLGILIKFTSHDLSAFYFEILKDRLYTEPTNSPLRQGTQAVLLEILDGLNFIIAPILPTLSQEIYSNYSDLLNESERVNVMGTRRWPNPDMRNSVNDVNYRDSNQLLMELQKVRADFMEWFNTKGKNLLSVKSTFQLNLTVSIPSTISNTFSSNELREIFMAASVKKVDSEADVWNVSAVASELSKCPRCWTFNKREYEEICFRCQKQLNLDPFIKEEIKIDIINTKTINS